MRTWPTRLSVLNLNDLEAKSAMLLEDDLEIFHDRTRKQRLMSRPWY
jgi:hypothetical protein